MIGTTKEITKDVSKRTGDISKITIFSLIGLGTGVILGLLSAKKPGEELKKDAEKEINKSIVVTKKGMREIKTGIQKIKTKCEAVIQETDFDNILKGKFGERTVTKKEKLLRGMKQQQA